VWKLLVNNPIPTFLLSVAIAIWVFFGRYAIYSWLWEVAGHEIIEVDREALRIERKALGLGYARRYLTKHIQDIRIVLPIKPTSSWARIMLREVPGGTIAFDYGRETIRFGVGASEAEAKQIVTELNKELLRIS
jgi:hypothetical protein